jgi:hypothetical protein
MDCWCCCCFTLCWNDVLCSSCDSAEELTCLDWLLCCLCLRPCCRKKIDKGGEDGKSKRKSKGPQYVETLFAVHVKNPKIVKEFLDGGGEPNSVPLFFDQQSLCMYRTCCCPCYVNGMVGEALGPLDPKDSDAFLCGNEEKGTADLAGGNRTLLHWAAFWQSEDSIKLLLAAGANINAKSIKGAKPLDVAQFVDAPLRIRTLLGEKNDALMMIDGLEYKGVDRNSTDTGGVRNSVDGRQSNVGSPDMVEMGR